MRSIATPCKKVCVIDPVRKLCSGCGRTLEEIAKWISYSPQERARIMALLDERLKAAGTKR
ncbi:MAG: DUF1289 domain-containing protein [Beijerinckiaceae bacterium]